MKKLFSKLFLAAVIMFGCSNTTMADDYGYETLVSTLIKGNSGILKGALWESQDDSDSFVFYSSLESWLRSDIKKLIVAHPKTILWVIHNFGDEALNLLNIEDCKRLKVELEKTLLAYEIVNRYEFETLAYSYISEHDKRPSNIDYQLMQEIGDQMEELFLRYNYPPNKYGKISYELMMAYFRRFSESYGNDISVDNETWEEILRFSLNIVQSKIEEEELAGNQREVLNISRQNIQKLEAIVNPSKSESVLLDLSKYFVNDSNGQFGDGYYILITRMYDLYYDGSYENQDKVLGKDLLEWIRYYQQFNSNYDRIGISLNSLDDAFLKMGEEAVMIDFIVEPVFNDTLKKIVVSVDGTIPDDAPFFELSLVDSEGNDICEKMSYIGNGKYLFILKGNIQAQKGEEYNFKLMGIPRVNNESSGLVLQMSIDSIETDSTVQFPKVSGPEYTLFYMESGSDCDIECKKIAANLITAVYTPLLF